MRVVFVADLHVGHRSGLAIPSQSPRGDLGAPERKALYRAWCAATRGPWTAPDALVIDGDAVDGQGRKRGGAEQWTTDLLEQVEHAADLIRMWGARRFYVLRGSGYHVEVGATGVCAEELLARKLHAEPYPNQEHVPEDRRERSGYDWYLTFDRLTFHIAHEIGVSRVFHYRSTPIAREMLHLHLNDALRHEYRRALQLGLLRDLEAYRTRIVVRAHAHYYWMCATSGTAGYNLPCWQARSAFQRQRGPLAIEPDIGFVGFEITGVRYRHEAVLWNASSVQAPPHTLVRRGRRATRQATRSNANVDRRKK